MVPRILVALALLCGLAHAEERPWAKGVSADDQAAALKQFDAANVLFERGSYLQALPKYEQALARWDHPAIHYNAAVCLINLDRSIEAYAHLKKAMAYGEDPLGKDLWKQATTYQRMLDSQIGTVVVTLAEPGAEVTVDGKPLSLDPATRSARLTLLATEEHRVVADKPGYDTVNKPIPVTPGKTTTIEIEMKRKTTGKLERRWKKWVPWAVITTGGVIAVAGAPFLLGAKSDFETYDERFAMACPDGCLDTDPALEGEDGANAARDSAELKQTIAISAFIAGGATIAAGIALVVLNQPRLVKPAITPMVGADRAGAIISVTW